MNLPNGDEAIVEQQKVTEYLLNPAHPDGAGKAQFFMALGFHRDRWQDLASALRHLAVSAPVAESMTSSHGRKYVVIGSIATPRGRALRVRTIWIIDHGMDTPRLVTAYPDEE
jgi:hypothetical protein